jgi:hypothetical protein
MRGHEAGRLLPNEGPEYSMAACAKAKFSRYLRSPLVHLQQVIAKSGAIIVFLRIRRAQPT